MKKLFLMALVAMAFVACDKEDGFTYDPMRLIPIRGYDSPAQVSYNQRGVQSFSYKGQQKKLTAHEICVIAYSDDFYFKCEEWSGHGFDKRQCDTINDILSMLPDEILKEDLSLNYNFIGAHNMVLISWGDTIGYIPNSELRNVTPVIEDLHAQGDYEGLFEIFDNAFRFYPCTGSEYRALKEQGLN